MGQKVNPKSFRLGITTDWNSKWYGNKKQYAPQLRQDVLLRKFLEKELRAAAVDRIGFERTAKHLNIVVMTGRPGAVIGRGGTGAEELKKKIKQQFFGSQKQSITITIREVEKPALSSRIVMMDIITDLEKRVPFRRVMKGAIGRVERAGAKGVKVMVAGRLNGAEIARTEALSSGSLPLHTLRADIDYCRGAAHTIYGTIGVKVWIYRGLVVVGEKP